eukprot:15446862-Alexandrium_andersonii.AAC.1
MPSNFCPGRPSGWSSAGGRRCRGKRTPPAAYEADEPCVFHRTFPGHPARLNTGFRRCLFCDVA